MHLPNKMNGNRIKNFANTHQKRTHDYNFGAVLSHMSFKICTTIINTHAFLLEVFEANQCESTLQ